ncbi:MAG: phosphoribosylanthranilate isomerase, partial [Halobacteriota archaeon]
MTWVKVCGMTSAEECAAAIDAGVDALGFIVDVPIASPRAIPVERARRLCADLPSSVTSVLVTMPSDPSRLVELIRSVPVDAVQLHGTDDPVTVEAMATAIERPIIVAASCDDPDVDRLVHAADALLVDTPGRSGRGENPFEATHSRE